MCPIDIDNEGCLLRHPHQLPDNLPEACIRPGVFFTANDGHAINSVYIITHVDTPSRDNQNNRSFRAMSVSTRYRYGYRIPVTINPQDNNLFRESARVLSREGGLDYLQLQRRNLPPQAMLPSLWAAFRDWRIQRRADKAAYAAYAEMETLAKSKDAILWPSPT